MECWFCETEKENISGDHNAVMYFKKYRYADKIVRDKKRKAKGKKEMLVIARCDDCYNAHNVYNKISLFSLIPFVVLAIACFLLFEKANQIIVFTLLAVSTIGFGIVVFIRMRYLSKRGIRSLVELEVKNEQIQSYLANGWYRKY